MFETDFSSQLPGCDLMTANCVNLGVALVVLKHKKHRKFHSRHLCNIMHAPKACTNAKVHTCKHAYMYIRACVCVCVCAGALHAHLHAFDFMPVKSNLLLHGFASSFVSIHICYVIFW